ncbi:hypothetical protein M1M07_22825 [Rhodococcus sp. HM1]|uniref:hypothetical protein n=1 Tax=Rhodococcus sp. HM1 TaxID=2937759 RepID=UPI00200B34A4|nr:hypothetical protein [Rhodococcus sp. HM1]MCK8673930.1 hypothetical protein [Rhodococcus sp. HM1]
MPVDPDLRDDLFMSAAAEPDDIASWVERLSRKAECGELLDLAEGFVFGSDARDPDRAEGWGTDRQIPAAALRAVLINRDLVVDPRGLRINGARITGPVDLKHVQFDRPLHLTTCRIDHYIVLTDSTLKELDLTGSRLTTLSLDRATVTGGLLADRLIAEGTVRAAGANIGEIQLNGATLTNPKGNALILDGATVTGGLLADRLIAEGTVRAVGANIGAGSLRGTRLTNPDGHALHLDGATVTNGLCADRLIAEGTVRAAGANIGEIQLSGATLTNPDGHALHLDGATIAGGLFADRLIAEGTVRAAGANIGEIQLNGATLTNPKGNALILDGATVTGTLYANTERTETGRISTEFIATGKIIAEAAMIGLLDLTGAILVNHGGTVLDLERASLSGGLYARGDEGGSSFYATGQISARNATIGLLDLTSARLLHGDSDGQNLDLESSTITTLKLRPDRVDGTLNLTRTTITDLRTPEKTPPQGRLVATGWQVADVHGLIRSSPRAATRWLGSSLPGRETCPKNADAQGEQRFRRDGFTAQPWHALAAVYDRNGQPADARRLRFTAANKTTTHVPWYSKPLRWIYLVVAGHGYYPLLAALWLVGVLALGFLIVENNLEHFIPADMTAAAEAATTHADENQALAPDPITAADSCMLYPDYPCFNSFNYALAGVVPPATGALKADWTISSTAPAVLAFGLPGLRILAWIFTAILLAGVTGLLRKT